MSLLHAASLRAALMRGLRFLRRYTGLVVALYLVQLAVAAAAGWGVTRVLASFFADRPLFDQAVDGDAAALLAIFVDHAPLWGGLFWLAVGAVAGYAILSWYLTGGLINVLLERPRTRRTTAAAFGAGGATTFFAYARLALWTSPFYVLALIVLGLGVGLVDGAADAVTMPALVGPLLAAVAPAAALLILTFTAVDYARVDVSRHPGLSSGRALARAWKLVFTRWRPLVHVLLYWVGFVLVSALLVALTLDRPMLGASGAVSLFFLRQGGAMLRFILQMVLVAGQVELAEAMQTPPPRRADAE